MKSIKLALMGGAALAVTSAVAHADELDALKAQIETLNARVAAMEATPSVPAGYSLLAISEGPRVNTPGLDITWKGSENAAYGNEATYITVLPTADAPAGATITWSGYTKAGVVYNNTKNEVKTKYRENAGQSWRTIGDLSEDAGDTDILARGQLRVTAATDTAVGEVGVDIRLRADFNGNGKSNVYSDVAWGYWAMTPEVTFGGGYAGSLGNIGYGYDGACSCYFTDSADLSFNPGDTTQLRLTYASGPLTAAVAFEDASKFDKNDGETNNTDKLGVAGELKYSGDAVNGEISAVWRDTDDNDFSGVNDLWQIGAGLGFNLGDRASLSLAAAYGSGPYQKVASNSSPDAGDITTAFPFNNTWWGITGLASVNLTEEVHAEIGAGYKSRSGDDYDDGEVSSDGLDGNHWGILGGIYYDPVAQLTIGVEAEYYVNNNSYTLTCVDATGCGDAPQGAQAEIDGTNDNFTLDFVSVWRF
jgi:hypothetical protein